VSQSSPETLPENTDTEELPEFLQPILQTIAVPEETTPPQPDPGTTEKKTPDQPETEPVREVVTAAPSETAVTTKWRDFVDEIAGHVHVSLVSLLRNSVVLELNDKRLVIGYQNLQVFTEKKREQISKVARTFFNDAIQVIFKESDEGLDDSLQVKHDIAKAYEIEKIREDARNDKRVTEIMALFPEAAVDDIILLNEKEEK
jgi:phosphoribosylanthranilate isomerase